MADTLVLDVGYQAVDHVNWQTSVVWWLIDRSVEVIDEHPDKFVHTVNWTVKMPSVVRFLKPIKRKKALKFSRHNVFGRDKGRCQYCSARLSHTTLTYDHVVPRSQGGKTNWNNIVSSCAACNNRKAHRTPEQAGMRLLSQPVKPKMVSDYHLGAKLIRWDPKTMPSSWEQWLRSAIYWQGEMESDE